MMRVVPRWTAIARESMARGVIFSDSARRCSTMPGTSRSLTSRVASGVTSRGLRPVPPQVKTTSAWSSSAMRISAAEMTARSSGQTS